MSELPIKKKLKNILSESQRNYFEFFGEESDNEMNQCDSCSEEEEQGILEHENNFHSDSNQYLKENTIINNCKNIDIKKLMLLNREKRKKVKELTNKTFQLLIQCQRQISLESEEIHEKSKAKVSSRFYTCRLVIPYFKDSQNNSAPSNDDVKKKILNKELFISHLGTSKKWSVYDQNILKSSVPFRYFQYNQKILEEKIYGLRTKCKLATGEIKRIMENDVARYTKEFNENFKIKSYDSPPLGCNDGIDWDFIANQDLKGTHTPGECYALWNIYLHPDINKSVWTREENNKLKKTAAKYRFQNWDKISEELNTGRSAFTTCLHYYLVLNKKFIKTRFNYDEDRLLLNLVEKYRVANYIPWGKISQSFQNRSRVQLYHRYRYFLQNKEIKKGPFSEAEDVLLMLLVRKFNKSFSQCAKYLKNRTTIQVRNRYQNYLRTSVKLRRFTLREDLMIMNYVQKNGRAFGPLTKALNRAGGSIRYRYHVLNKWLQENPGKDVKQFPRISYHKQYCRKYRQTVTETIYERLSKQNQIPSLTLIEKIIRKERLKTNSLVKSKSFKSKYKYAAVERELRDYFKPCHKLKPSNVSVSENKMCIFASATKIILDSLGATFMKELNEQDILNNKYLDDVDRKLLNFMLEEEKGQENISSQPVQTNKVLPPNIHTLMGLRGLLLKHHAFKTQLQLNKTTNCLIFNNTDYNKLIQNNMKKELSQMDKNKKLRVIEERKTFMLRFYSLFRLPAIMSLLEIKCPVSKETSLPNSNEEETQPEKCKKKGRPFKKKFPKIALMNAARLEKKKSSNNLEEANCETVQVSEPVQDESDSNKGN